MASDLPTLQPELSYDTRNDRNSYTRTDPAHDREVWDAAVTACVATCEARRAVWTAACPQRTIDALRALLGGPKEQT